jgi:hypothetical protein
MLDLINGARFFKTRILQEKAFHEAAVDIDVDVFVDRGRDEKSRVLPVIGWQVGASASQGNPKW